MLFLISSSELELLLLIFSSCTRFLAESRFASPTSPVRSASLSLLCRQCSLAVLGFFLLNPECGAVLLPCLVALCLSARGGENTVTSGRRARRSVLAAELLSGVAVAAHDVDGDAVRARSAIGTRRVVFDPSAYAMRVERVGARELGERHARFVQRLQADRTHAVLLARTLRAGDGHYLLCPPPPRPLTIRWAGPRP